MKINEMGEKFWDIFSDVHTIISILMGNRSPTEKPSNNSGRGPGIKADSKGRDQTDERLTLTAFARAIERAVKEDVCCDFAEAKKRALRILKIINSYNPLEIRCLSLTFGLEQSTVTHIVVEEPKDTNKKGEEDRVSQEKTFAQNKEGQDMFIALIRSNDDTFTRAFCDFAISATKIFGYNVAKWQQTALDFLSKSDIKITQGLEELGNMLDKPFQKMSKDNPDGLYKPPLWTDFMIFGRKAAIERCREKHLENLRKTK